MRCQTMPRNGYWTGMIKSITKNLLIRKPGGLKDSLSSADLVGKLIIFNVSGNKFRLITAIHFNTNMVYVRDVLTHAEYDKEGWKT